MHGRRCPNCRRRHDGECCGLPEALQVSPPEGPLGMACLAVDNVITHWELAIVVLQTKATALLTY